MNRKTRRASDKTSKGTLNASFGPEADRMFALGLQHHQAGQLDAAITHYQAAIGREPRFAAARNNLGSAFLSLGHFADAAAQFKQAIPLKPDVIGFYDNLGRALLGMNEAGEALRILRRALALGGAADTKRLFITTAAAQTAWPDLPDFQELMTRALSEPWSRPNEVGAIVSRLLVQDRALKGAIDGTAQTLGRPELDAIAGHRLFRALLETTPVCGVELERLLTTVRRTVLALASESSAAASERALGLAISLARQCFLNEYVYAADGSEADQALALRDALADSIESGAAIDEIVVAAVAAYFPLHSLKNGDALIKRKWSKRMTALLTQQVLEPNHERRMRAEIAALTPIDDEVSVLVREQYEENPYPRWIAADPVGPAPDFDSAMRQNYPLSRYQEIDKGDSIDILVAGCGTGRYLVELAREHPRARILAIDLSLSSLSYARRKAEESGIKHIEFAQADILRIGAIEGRYDVIEAGGVLHHLRDPQAGWRTLLSVLRPRGCMRVALYSAIAHSDISATQTYIAERGYGRTATDIRRARQDLMRHEPGTPQRNMAGLADFFTLSECRDLLFHVHEHRHTIPELASFIARNDLEFIGFNASDAINQRYQARFPDDPARTNLDNWHVFETENPRTFAAMYQFWVQKKAASG